MKKKKLWEPMSQVELRDVTRALISVSDKTGIVDFARTLAGHGVELLSTGGTYAALAEAGVGAGEVEIVDGFAGGSGAVSNRVMVGLEGERPKN